MSSQVSNFSFQVATAGFSTENLSTGFGSKEAETLAGLLLELMMDAVKPFLPKAISLKMTQQADPEVSLNDATHFSFNLEALTEVMKEANPTVSNRHGVCVNREQLVAILKGGQLSGESQKMIQVLLRYFNVLAGQSRAHVPGYEQKISEMTLKHIAMMQGQGGQFSYEGLVTFRALSTTSGISIEDISAVMEKISGKNWERIITREVLEAFIDQPNLAWEEKNIALLLLNNFERFSHVDMSQSLQFIDMSDVQAIAHYSNPKNPTVISREGVSGIVLSTREKKQIERWLDNHHLDENGCPRLEKVSHADALTGYFDRYDRILNHYSDRPWKKFWQ